MRMSTAVTTCLLPFAVAASVQNAIAEPNDLRNAYFGETHMHTAYSLDAYIGGARLLPSAAYR